MKKYIVTGGWISAGCLSALLCASLSMRTDAFADPRANGEERRGRSGENGGNGGSSPQQGNGRNEDSDYPLPYIPERFKPAGLPVGGGGTNPDVTPDTGDEACRYFYGTLHKEGVSGSGVSENPIVVGKEAVGNRCVTELVDYMVSGGTTKNGKQWLDDNFAYLLALKVFGGRFASAPSAPAVLANGAVCTRFENLHSGPVIEKGYYCTDGYWYFGLDEAGECEYVSEAQATAACGADITHGLGVNFLLSSPISLVWNNGTDIDAISKIVNFPLELGSGRDFCSWKGSTDTPLLVYDPSHGGNIRSAEQLFGNWTFGGKRTASLGSRGEGMTPEPWSNGYEALATLDADGDNRLSGAELDTLALWFDDNRDAVSQPGEVRSLKTAGVRTLFYQPDRTDAVSGHIFASRGFEREEHGRIISGSSVDWFAETAGSPGELMAKHFMSSPAAVLPKPLVVQEPQPSLVGKESFRAQPATGIWQFALEADRERPAAAGYLVITAASSGDLLGYSVLPQYLSPSDSHRINSRVSARIIRGRVEGNRLSFASTHEGNRISTEATISSDGKVLLGKSKVYFVDKGRNKTWEYDWRAVRGG